MRFQDKIAIVTGGGSSMGKEVAGRFVAEGGSVVINGRNGPKAEASFITGVVLPVDGGVMAGRE
jgi:NADP-dependent 3-hydroxy acid dehydrogenase YdfG